MRIIDTSATRRSLPLGSPHRSRAANVEAAGLALATLVVVAGLCLAVWGRLGSPGVAVGAPPLLSAIEGPGALAPLLVTIDHAGERLAVAERLLPRVHATDEPLEHVGALASVTMAVGEVRADRRFVALRARVEGRPASDRVRVLTATDLAGLKARVAVRTPHAYASRLGRLVLWFVVAFWVAHLVRRLRGASDDPIVLPVLLVLCGLGLMAMIALGAVIMEFAG